MIINYSWPVWNFTIPAIIVAIIFVKDAYSIKSADSTRWAQSFGPSELPVLPVAPMVSQTVDVVYSEETKAEGFDEEKEEMKWRARSRYAA